MSWYRPLTERIKDVPQKGRVMWIGVRPAHEVAMVESQRIEVIEAKGLVGDRASKARIGGKRQVTLIQAEHLGVIAKLTGHETVTPASLRRNLVIEGINLIALKTLKFRIGDQVILEGTGPCEPCSKMDIALGEGGFQAMRGHGGITTRVIAGGFIQVGDVVAVIPE